MELLLVMISFIARVTSDFNIFIDLFDVFICCLYLAC